ncbi:MAG TPA: AMP-binding protein [Ramlibacter sp.]|nr:AMP-binding protein [Ramlibacter sp.]
MHAPSPPELSANHRPYAARYRAAGDWVTDPVPDFVAAWAARTPDRVALVDREGQLSYAELARLVRRAAAGLWALGLRPGDSLALQMPNWREFAIFQQAAARIGVCYVPLLPQMRAAEIAYLLGASRACAIVLAAAYRGFDHLRMLQALRPSLPLLRHMFVAAAPAGLCREGSVWSTHGFLGRPWEDEYGEAVDAVQVHPDALRHVLFTSGTEARPKGVLHSFNTAFFPLKRHQSYFALGPDDAILTGSTVGHGIGAMFGVELGLFLGGKVVLMEAWSAADALAVIERERCTLMWATTTFWTDLVNAPEARQHDLSSFRLALTAGAPVLRPLVAQVRETLGATLVAAYGQSEGHNMSIHRKGESVERITSSDGLINAGIDYKLVDADRQPVPRGQPGEFAYRGPNVCLGYLDPAHTARAFDAEGFIHSGDLVEVDEQGYLRVVGRQKDIIIRGGENISPAELEEIVYQHPAVADAAVIGVDDERLGQRTCAVVVLRKGASLSLCELVDFFRERQVAKFKWPERLEIVTEFPRTAVGKVRKDVLRTQVLAASQAGAAD